MKKTASLAHRSIALLAAALASPLALAQTAAPSPGPWRFGGTLYAYLPSVSGTSRVPADGAGTPIEVDAGKILDSLKFTVMGTLEAHNGRWGGFTDVVYLNLGGDKQQSRDFTIGSAGLPAGTTADIGWDLKGVVWTLAGQYRLVADPGLTLDALGGARLFDLKQTTRWNISGDLGAIAPEGRSGSSKNEQTLVDAIVGINGRIALGASTRWSVPFYLDIGAGRSDLTWQAAGGVSYSYPWGEVKLMWRHLAYELKSGNNLKDVGFSGPLLGATWRW